MTLLIYPDVSSSFQYYTGESNSTEIKCNEVNNGFIINFSKKTGSIIIRLKNNSEPEGIRLSGNINLIEKNSFSDFEGSSLGWFQGKVSGNENIYTWIKFSDPADTIYVNTACDLGLYPDNYELSNLNEGNKYYIDRDFTLTTVPDAYKGLNMIKTANENKTTTNLNLHFNLCSSSDVYIAYDHRLSTPSWITGNYQNTGEKIYVSDTDMGYFNIWKRTLQPGIINFGDNEGSNQSSMYFVFYKPYEALPVYIKVFLQGPYY